MSMLLCGPGSYSNPSRECVATLFRKPLLLTTMMYSVSISSLSGCLWEGVISGCSALALGRN